MDLKERTAGLSAHTTPPEDGPGDAGHVYVYGPLREAAKTPHTEANDQKAEQIPEAHSRGDRLGRKRTCRLEPNHRSSQCGLSQRGVWRAPERGRQAGHLGVWLRVLVRPGWRRSGRGPEGPVPHGGWGWGAWEGVFRAASPGRGCWVRAARQFGSQASATYGEGEESASKTQGSLKESVFFGDVSVMSPQLIPVVRGNMSCLGLCPTSACTTAGAGGRAEAPRGAGRGALRSCGDPRLAVLRRLNLPRNSISRWKSQDRGSAQVAVCLPLSIPPLRVIQTHAPPPGLLDPSVFCTRNGEPRRGWCPRSCLSPHARGVSDSQWEGAGAS